MTQLDVRHATTQESRTLTIRLTSGTGHGRTTLAAFDAALRSAGVADHNLIRLSSVIPPGSVITTCSPQEQLRGDFGDALYCVYAVAYAGEVGDAACAGIGWSLANDGSRRGLFVEHSGRSEQQVSDLIAMTLGDMSAGRHGSFVPTGQLLSSVECHGQPACAVVVATYRTAGWGQE